MKSWRVLAYASLAGAILLLGFFYAESLLGNIPNPFNFLAATDMLVVNVLAPPAPAESPVSQQTANGSIGLTRCVPSADLNCDGHVNTTDFSMMLYWFKRPLADIGYIADLNNDAKVDLIDFSILASQWTD